MSTREQAASRQYLLFAGQEGSPGGLGDLVGVFGDETAARTAFTALRLGSKRRHAAWADLGAVDLFGNCAVLCWFGHDRPVPGARHQDTGPEASRRRAFWRRRRRAEAAAREYHGP